MHPLVNLSVPEGKVAVHWFEQSTFALKDSRGTVIQIDPYFPHDRPADRFIYPEPPLDESQLPTDYVLLTHDHGDHTNPESIRRIWRHWPKAQFIGPEESVNNILKNTAVDKSRVRTIRAGESIQLGAFTAHAVYAKPPEGHPDAGIQPPDVTHLGYVIKVEGVTLYFSGDVINTFAELDALVQPIAALKPDIGFLTNHPTEGEFPFFDGSVKMARRIGLKHAAPSHYACFVKRNYDPNAWTAQFPADGPRPLIIPRNSHIVYPA
jgi:L-ascorbate metabolism protein UlaG (beta-lactamase superfamily)